MKMNRRRILAFLAAALLLTGCSTAPVEEPQLPPIDLAGIVEAAVPSGGEIRRAGAQLRPDDQRLYALVVQKLDALAGEISFSGKDIETISQIWDAVLADYPEFFWLTGAYRYGAWDSLDYLWFEPVCVPELSRVPRQRAEAEAVCSALLDRAEGMGEYERALFFHDYLVEHTTYDVDSVEDILDKDTDSASRTAYGCLVEHLAVCSGYAKAFQWLAQRSGLECLRVNGKDLEDDVGHEWDCVRLDGDYYYIDPTWDDPVPEEGAPEILSHDYFCITTEELLRTHKLDEGQDLPECTATKYDYYRMQGQYFEEYDAEQVGQRIRELIDSGETTFSFKFGSAEECTRAMDDLFEGQRFFEYAEEYDSVSCGTSEDGRILTILL